MMQLLHCIGGSQVARHFTSLLTGTASVQLIGLLTLPVLTRIFTPAEIGSWALYLTMVLTVGALAGLRLDLALFAGDELPQGDITKAYSAATLITTAVLALVLLPFVLVEGGLFELGVAASILLVVNIAVFAFFQLAQTRMNRAENFRGMARLRIEQAVSTSLLQVSMGLVGVGLLGLVLATLIGYSLPVLLRLRIVTDGFRDVERGYFRRVLRTHWRQPVFNGAAALADAVRLNGLNVIVAAVHSAYWLGLYSMAWRVVLMPSGLLSSVLAQVYLPRFADHRDSGLRRQVLQCGAVSAAVGVLPFSVLWLFGEDLFAFVLGADWRTAGTVATNLTPYLFMAFVTAPLSNVFIVTNRQGLALIFSLVYAIVPVAVLFAMREDFLQATVVMGLAMAGLLVVNLLLVHWVSGRPRAQQPEGKRGADRQDKKPADA